MKLPQLSAPVHRTASAHALAASGISPAECVSVVVQNGQICLDLPVVGNECISVPIPGSGTLAQACIDLCTTLGFPTGVCVSVSVGGIQVTKECFGYGC